MPGTHKTIEQTWRFVTMVASHQGWVLNSDQDFLESLVEGLTVNHNRYGYYLCPCRDTLGSRESDADVICPCQYAGPDISEYGQCYCALYLSEALRNQGQEPRQIPERRPLEA
ncbi:MAG: ferredoxin:thioredoxin reductase [Spirochaetales bacterium]|nr:ferredoxin:thioredoxin reductase [Spirochaetales bacterium]